MPQNFVSSLFVFLCNGRLSCVYVEQGVECLEKLKDMLLEQCATSSSPDVQDRFEKLLEGNGHSLGLLLSERFINVPPQIALPMHKQLQ